jgi:hypothetical protein
MVEDIFEHLVRLRAEVSPIGRIQSRAKSFRALPVDGVDSS